MRLVLRNYISDQSEPRKHRPYQWQDDRNPHENATRSWARTETGQGPCQLSTRVARTSARTPWSVPQSVPSLALSGVFPVRSRDLHGPPLFVPRSVPIPGMPKMVSFRQPRARDLGSNVQLTPHCCNEGPLTTLKTKDRIFSSIP